MTDITVDIGALAAIVTALTVIGAPIVVLLRKALLVLKKLDDNRDDIEDSKKERKILLKATLACLRGLEELGCNGPVKKGIEELENHMIEAGHR